MGGWVETAGDVGAGGVFGGEGVVCTAGAVDLGAAGDVVDGAVEGEVDWGVGGGAVVLGELGGC